MRLELMQILHLFRQIQSDVKSNRCLQASEAPIIITTGTF